MSDNKSYALAYLEKGLSVIPICFCVERVCKIHTNCKSPNKTPIISWKKYQEERPTEEEINKWWTDFPEANIGIVTGAISGLTVVDVEKDGDVSGLPPTLIAKTGGGGWHFYYKYAKGIGNKARIRELTDIRSDGGFVVAPPSVHTSGRKYEWVTKEQKEDFPIEILKETNKIGLSNKHRNSVNDGVTEGTRNATLASLAGRYRRINLPLDDALTLLRSFAEKCKPPIEEEEFETTVRSIYKYEVGLRGKNIEEEPLVEMEDNSFKFLYLDYGITLYLNNLTEIHGDMVGEFSYEINRPDTPRIITPPSKLNILAERSRSGHAKEINVRTGADGYGIMDAVCRTALAGIRQPLKAIIRKDIVITENNWIVPPFVLDNQPSILFGDGGSGKSFLALALACTVQIGTDKILGITPTRHENTLFVDWEDDENVFAKRLDMITKGAGLEEIPSVAYLRAEQSLRDIIRPLKGVVKERQIGLVVIDSAVMASGNEPEKADTARGFFEALRTLRTSTLIISHQTKNGDESRKPFGSTYYHNAARSTIEVRLERSEDTHITLLHRKANNDVLHSPIAYKLVFTNGSVVFEATDPLTTEAGIDNTSRKDLVFSALSDQVSLNVEEIVKETGLKSNAVRGVLSRNRDTFRKRKGNRWSLASRGDSNDVSAIDLFS